MKHSPPRGGADDKINAVSFITVMFWLRIAGG